jgi:hypothetical protein
LLHIEKQLSGAAARGDAERQMVPETLRLYEEVVPGAGKFAVAETRTQQQNLEEARRNNRNAFPIMVGNLIGSWGSAKGLGKEPAGPQGRPPRGGGRAGGGGGGRAGGGGGGRAGGGGGGRAEGGSPASPPEPLRVVSPTFRYDGRDVLVVETSAGRQGMYRSSGDNSGMPRTWLPFDEIFEQNHLMFNKGWWNKQNYTAEPGGWGRFGSEELYSISQQLHAANLAESPYIIADEFNVNKFLDSFGARITGNNVFRPTGDTPKVLGP